MICKAPESRQVSGLRLLWKTAFGDDDAYLDQFFSTAYDSRRALCITDGEAVAAALYWFGCSCRGQKFAYLYAVATDPAYRRRGLCRSLMEETLTTLKRSGYAGAILVPAEDYLTAVYAGMGFLPCTAVSEFRAAAGGEALPLKRIGTAEYAACRRALLPEGSVIQEGENLSYFETQTGFYAGSGCVLAGTGTENGFFCQELLGDPGTAPGILRQLGYEEGSFRVPGTDSPFSMYCPLQPDCPKPTYFGLAFD